MLTEPKEYSLAELIEHPALGLAMENDGIDRRSVKLLLEDLRRDDHAEHIPVTGPVVD